MHRVTKNLGMCLFLVNNTLFHAKIVTSFLIFIINKTLTMGNLVVVGLGEL